MGLFQFSELEILCFFVVWIRLSVLFAIFPIFGDRFVPITVRTLLGLIMALICFGPIVSEGWVRVASAAQWGQSLDRLVTMIFSEAMIGLVLGWVSKLAFDGISFGANLAGHYMGFAAASTYDAHQESQTQEVAQIQLSIAMLLFLSLDGHHMLIQSAIHSFEWVPLGHIQWSQQLSNKLIGFSSQLIVLAIKMSAPLAIVLFSVNVAFGLISKAMPQINILILSMSAGGLIGLIVLWWCLPEMGNLWASVFESLRDWIKITAYALAGKAVGG